MADKKGEQLQPQESVASRILGAFVDAVGEEEGLSEVSGRLREQLIEKENLEEDAIREALFGRSL